MRFKFLNGEIYSVHSAALILGAAGLFSRILGVFRDHLLAGKFGAGRELDIYYAAFQIPDFLSAVFFLGAGAAAILPLFQDYLAKDADRAKKLISDLSFLFISGSLVFSAIGFIFAPVLLRFLAPGFSESERNLTLILTRIMLISPVFFGLSSIFSVVVQSFRRFWAYALAPIFYNLGIITGILVFVPLWGISGLAIGVALGAFLHFAIQLKTAAGLGFKPSLTFKYSGVLSRGVKSVLKVSFPRFFSLALSQLTILVLVALGSTLDEGSIAVFQFAANLYFVPVGIFGVSYAVAIFPRLSRAYINKDAQNFFRELFLGVRTILFWIAPSMVLFIVLRAHIVRLALGSGRFSWEDTRLTAAALAAFAIAMFSWSLTTLLIRSFYALGNTWIPLVINIGAFIVSLSTAFFLTNFLESGSGFDAKLAGLFKISDLRHTGVLGLALGFSIGQIFDSALMYFALVKFAKKKFNFAAKFPAVEIIKMSAAALVAGAAAYSVRLALSDVTLLNTFFSVFWEGLAVGFAGIVIYFAALFLLKSEDIYSFAESFKRGLFKLKMLPKNWDGSERDIQLPPAN